MSIHPLIRSVPYDASTHDARTFNCGEPELDQWIEKHATVSAQMNTARTYVWTRSNRIVGYYAVAPHALLRADAPNRIARNSPDPIPGFIIGKLAVDAELRHQGAGGALLLDAIARLVGAAETIGGRVIVVDAINEDARAFYARHGFSNVPNNRMRLYVGVSAARSTVAAAIAGTVDG